MGVKESGFNQVLRSKLATLGFKIDRVESHATAPGIADDAWQHKKGRSGWLEVKEVEMPPKRVLYRPNQALWLSDHWAAGGLSATIIRVKHTDSVILIPGCYSLQAEHDLKRLIESKKAIVGYTHNSGFWEFIATMILTMRDKP